MSKTAVPASTYQDQLDLALIHKHPKNPRRRAIADPELVASVKSVGILQPIVVAPHPTRDGDYVLIAGHRRLDACKKNKLRTAPAIVRTDLTAEAQQLEAMLIENGHRSDLTPMEEAEGYHQLTLFPGYTQKRVATTMGVDPKTVSARIKLLKLAKSTQTKIHGGQIRLEDALAMVEFADDPKATKELERDAGTSSFRYTLEKSRKARKLAKECDVEIARLTDLGAAERPYPAGTPSWQMYNETYTKDATPSPLNYFNGPLQEEQTHAAAGCLGWVYENKGDAYSAKIRAVCLKPDTHDEQLDEAERLEREQDEQDRRDREAKAAAKAAAATLRLETVAELANGATLGKGLDQVVRAILPMLVAGLDDEGRQGVFFDAINHPADARWEASTYRRKDVDLEKVNGFYRWVAGCSDTTLAAALVAYLAAAAEDYLQHQHTDTRTIAARQYLEFLQDVGHPFNEVDRELLAKIEGADA